MTLEKSDKITWAPSISLVADSLARTYRSRETLPELPGPGLVYGQKCLGFLGSVDLNSQSLKTCVTSLDLGFPKSSLTLPQSGMMRNGRLYRQETLERRTLETEYGLLPTPRAQDGKGHYVATLNTARTRVGPNNKGYQAHWIHVYLHLMNLKKGWANPQFSEWMMGYPIEYTALAE